MRLLLNIPELGGENDLLLAKGRYTDGTTALRLFCVKDGFPFCTLTVALEDPHVDSEREVCIKTWSENAPVVKAIRKELMGKVFVDTGRRVTIPPFGVEVEIWKVISQQVLDMIEPIV